MTRAKRPCIREQDSGFSSPTKNVIDQAHGLQIGQSGQIGANISHAASHVTTPDQQQLHCAPSSLPSMASIQDRTHEFRTCVDSIRKRSAHGSEAKQRLLQNGGPKPKSEFSRMASAIGKDISSTTIKLNKLGQRASSSFLFPMFSKSQPLVQSRNAKLSSTTGQSKLVSAPASTLQTAVSKGVPGTHFHRQARYRQP